MRVFLLAVGLWFLCCPPSMSSSLLSEPFTNERLHVRLRPPKGWHLAQGGLSENEPLEFWREDEYGPRIQVVSFLYPLTDPSNVDEAQRELSRTLVEQSPELEIIEEKKLTHQGNPAVEVMATLPTGDTFYHVIQRCLFAEGRIYIITCASFESSFLSDLPVFRACLDSVEALGDIHDPASLGERTDHLVQPTTFSWIMLGIALWGLILRRLSTSRLERMRR